jgi:hypothetical protein
MEPHLHFGVEHWISIGLIALIFRYVWKWTAGMLAGLGGMPGQVGLAMGGIAQ